MKFVYLFLILMLSNCSNPVTCDPSKLIKGITTEEDILKYCGKPSYINANSYNKQWVYREGFPYIGGTYIYTENGRFRSAYWKE